MKERSPSNSAAIIGFSALSMTSALLQSLSSLCLVFGSIPSSIECLYLRPHQPHHITNTSSVLAEQCNGTRTLYPTYPPTSFHTLLLRQFRIIRFVCLIFLKWLLNSFIENEERDREREGVQALGGDTSPHTKWWWQIIHDRIVVSLMVL